MKKHACLRLLALLLTLQCLLVSCLPADLLSPAVTTQGVNLKEEEVFGSGSIEDLTLIPEYTGSPFVALNGNVPQFSKEDHTVTSYECYSDLDALGRCGVATACVGIDLMPTEDRESISSVKPSGWQSVKYDIVEGNYLYNRCHLIGFQLSGENANEKNLITGTRYMNVDGMLPFENLVADYVKETKNHVLFRVTPVFVGEELVARGVQMEAWSVEDKGEGVCFNVFVYNVQPGITIDYATGKSHLTQGAGAVTTPAAGEVRTYILNTNTKKFHYPNCSSVTDMSEANKATYEGSREDLIADGYAACGRCKP